MTAVSTLEETEMRANGLKRRVEAVREKMRQTDLEVLVAYATNNHSFFQSMNVCWYFTGFKQMGLHSALIIPAEGPTTYVMTPPWDRGRAQERVVSIDQLISTDDDSFFDTVRHPWMEFVSDPYLPDTLAHGGQLHGRLTLRGTTRPERLDVAPAQCARPGLDCAMEVHGDIQRGRYGMDDWQVMLSERVRFTMQVWLSEAGPG